MTEGSRGSEIEVPGASSRPTVSVVIPTCNRPVAVRHAVESALAQTLRSIEVIVVLAAPSKDTIAALSAIEDPRLRVVQADGSLNASSARNRGIRQAAGQWIAFLDDDDAWLPAKLELQLEAASRSSFERPVISCRMIARSPSGDVVWPRRIPQPGEPVGDYLFRRRSVFGGGGYLQTSTLFAQRELWVECPFREDIVRVEDLDWAIRAGHIEGCGFEMAGKEPLVIWDIDDSRPRASSAGTWRDAAAWIEGSRNLVSPEAYASYLLTWISLDAAREERGLGAMLALWRQARNGGKPSLLDVFVHLGHFLIPHRLLRKLSSIGKRRLARLPMHTESRRR